MVGAMPEHYHPHDKAYIAAKLAPLRREEREQVAKAYSKVYMEHYDNENVSVKKEGKARREANTRLRRYIDKKFKIRIN